MARVFLQATLLLGLLSSIVIPGISQTWMQLSPLNPPGPTAAPGVYDPATNRMIVFGANNSPAYTNEVWVLTNANGLGGAAQWQKLSPIADPVNGFPSARQPWVAYDAVDNRLIIMDGCLGFCLPVATDQWVLSNANGLGGTPAWFKLSPIGGPPGPRVDHVMAYDSATNSLIVFGGQNGCCANQQTYGDVWVLSNANGMAGTPVWTQLNPAGGPPPGQDGVSGVYDSANNRLIVFGGFPNQSQTFTNAVWVLSNANGFGGTPVWTNIVSEGATGSPTARRFPAAVYDSSSNNMTIFGGYNGGTYFNDTWVLSNANGMGGTPVWTQLTPTGGPPAGRVLTAATLDPASHRITIFGGGGLSASFNDTWLLTPSPLYSVCLLYDPTKAVRSGATQPIKLQLCNGSGADQSSSNITLHAVSITQTSTSIAGPVEDSGNANPDSDFRFDLTLGTTGGYIFNLKTSGLIPGTYNLNFSVTGDSFVYVAPFQVK